jgi:trehalose-phosphatase
MLDYDGTLAPLNLNRMDAVLPPGTRAALQALSNRSDTALAIVSGRGMNELLPLTEGLRLTRIGEHGWDIRDANGAERRPALPPAAAKALDDAEASARARGLGARLERKRTGLVLHLRDLPPDRANAIDAEVRGLWRDELASGTLRLDPIHGGLELRAAGRNKGTAALEQIAREPAGSLAVYVGDDVTDEDAFAAIRGRGFGIRVGSPDAPTAATGWLDSPGAVGDFLEEWLRVTGGLSHPAAS